MERVTVSVGVYCFSSGFDVEPVFEPAVLEDPISASKGAGGGVVNMVQPIQPVIPRTPRTARTIGIPSTQGLQSAFVNATMYPMKTRTDTTKIRPPYDWSLFT